MNRRVGLAVAVIVLVGCSNKVPAHDDRDAILSQSIADAKRSGDAAVDATARFIAQNGTRETVTMSATNGLLPPTIGQPNIRGEWVATTGPGCLREYDSTRLFCLHEENQYDGH